MTTNDLRVGPKEVDQHKQKGAVRVVIDATDVSPATTVVPPASSVNAYTLASVEDECDLRSSALGAEIAPCQSSEGEDDEFLVDIGA